nr:hypothetical protein [Escherichia coli]
MTAEEKSVLSLFMIGVLIVVGKVLAGGEPITPRLFIGRMLLGGFVCRNIWASLPGAGYGQREHSLEKLVTVWRTAGGVPA